MPPGLKGHRRMSPIRLFPCAARTVKVFYFPAHHGPDQLVLGQGGSLHALEDQPSVPQDVMRSEIS